MSAGCTNKRSPRTAPCVSQGIRGPWAAHEDLKPIDTSHGCENAFFFVYFVASTFAAWKHLPWRSCIHRGQPADRPPTLHATSPHHGVCGATKYTKYTKTRARRPRGMKAARSVSWGRFLGERLSRDDSVGSVVLARSACANPSLPTEPRNGSRRGLQGEEMAVSSRQRGLWDKF